MVIHTREIAHKITRLGVKYNAMYLSPSTSTLLSGKYKYKSKYSILTEYLSPSTSTLDQVQVQVPSTFTARRMLSQKVDYLSKINHDFTE